MKVKVLDAIEVRTNDVILAAADWVQQYFGLDVGKDLRDYLRKEFDCPYAN